MTTYCRIKGTLATKTVYTCHTCGRQEEGTKHNIEVDCTSSSEVQATLEKAGQQSHDMPYGWCYTGVYTCAQCLVRAKLKVHTDPGSSQGQSLEER
jgi:hypothetical protein